MFIEFKTTIIAEAILIVLGGLFASYLLWKDKRGNVQIEEIEEPYGDIPHLPWE